MRTITPQALRSDPRSAPSPLPPCDCLTFCGDDPNVFNGNAQPCAAIAALQAKREEASELHTLAFKCAEIWARCVLGMTGTPVLTNGHIHTDITPSQSDDKQWLARVNEAARLLVLLKKAEQHPTRPHLLRLL
jgi:hypothetical protein